MQDYCMKLLYCMNLSSMKALEHTRARIHFIQNRTRTVEKYTVIPCLPQKHTEQCFLAHCKMEPIKYKCPMN